LSLEEAVSSEQALIKDQPRVELHYENGAGMDQMSFIKGRGGAV